MPPPGAATKVLCVEYEPASAASVGARYYVLRRGDDAACVLPDLHILCDAQDGSAARPGKADAPVSLEDLLRSLVPRRDAHGKRQLDEGGASGGGADAAGLDAGASELLAQIEQRAEAELRHFEQRVWQEMARANPRCCGCAVIIHVAKPNKTCWRCAVRRQCLTRPRVFGVICLHV